MCRQFEPLPRAAVEEIARLVEHGLAFQLGAECATDAFTVAQEDACAMAFPGSTVPVIVQGPSQSNDCCVEDLTWGFSVEWSKQLVFNTRVETALGRESMWKDALEHHRCAIPIRAFYETHGAETVRSPKTGKPIKRRYRFEREQNADQVFFLAGIYEGTCFSVMTTEPNAVVAPIHDRMPLLLRAQDIPAWLGDDYVALAKPSSLALRAVAAQESGEVQLSLF